MGRTNLKEKKKKIVQKVRAGRPPGEERRSTNYGKTTLVSVARRQTRVIELHRQGYTHFDIVAKLAEEGVKTSQPTVSRDIQEMVTQLADTQIAETEKYRSQQLDRISYIKRRAWEEFEFSRHRQVAVKPSKGDADQTTRVEVVRQEGNMEWLELIGEMEQFEARITGTILPSTTQNNLILNDGATLNWATLMSPATMVSDPVQERLESVRRGETILIPEEKSV